MTEEENRRIVYAQEDVDDASPTTAKKKKKIRSKIMMVSLNEIFREREKSRSMSPVISNGSGGNEDVQLNFRGSPNLFHDYRQHVTEPNEPWYSVARPDGMKRLGPFRARPFYPEKHVKKHTEMQMQSFQGKPT